MTLPTPAFAPILPNALPAHSRLPRTSRLRPTPRPRLSMAMSQRTVRPPLALSTEGAESFVPSPTVQVHIDRPAPNRRIISAVNLISAPLPVVWDLLSDYSRLADYIPNLVMSHLRPHPSGGIRLEQCGAQNILGFKFRASLTMDMAEVDPLSSERRAITFSLVSSSDFRQFQGAWHLKALTSTKTALYYNVSIVPKGLVPVRAIEWRIAEDVPQNMDAVRLECERRRRIAVAERIRNTSSETPDSS